MSAAALVKECVRCGISGEKAKLRATDGLCADCRSVTTDSKSSEVVALYRRLERNRRRVLKTKAAHDESTGERAQLWRLLLEAGEDQAPIARASGVHKSYVKKDLERREKRAGNGAA